MKKYILFPIISFLLFSSCSSVYQMLHILPASVVKEIRFSQDAANARYTFWYPDTTSNLYLRELRNQYHLTTLIQQEHNDIGKIKVILDWTSKQWKHNGSNTPTMQDALTILKEAHEGKQFRCVEYGVVVTTALNSIGFSARTLGLKTRDVEKVKYAAGHVVSEVYSAELKKWMYIDPQFNIIPVLDETPLNAVEFQKEIYAKNIRLKLINLQGELSEKEAEKYINWVGKYLFYFDILFDQQTMNNDKRKNIDGMTKLTLVPVGKKEPHIFQRKGKINNSFYSCSLRDFYRIPE